MVGYIATHRGKGLQPIEVRKTWTNRHLLYRIRNRFLEQGCRCGETDVTQLECHHKNPATKEYNIGELIFVNCLPEILLAELKKCEVICKRCHDLVHPEVRNVGTSKEVV